MPLKATRRLAQEARDAARAAYARLGPGNVGLTDDEDDGDRLFDAATQVHRVREILGPNMRLTGVVARTALNSGASACHEMAAVAFQYLKRLDVQPIYLLCLAPPGDHVFAALGELAPGADISRLETWGDRAYVCDPWVGAACRARDYKARWTACMRAWGVGGAGILRAMYPDGRKVFADPLGPDWIGAIDRHKLQLLDTYPGNASTDAKNRATQEMVRERLAANMRTYNKRSPY